MSTSYLVSASGKYWSALTASCIVTGSYISHLLLRIFFLHTYWPQFTRECFCHKSIMPSRVWEQAVVIIIKESFVRLAVICVNGVFQSVVSVMICEMCVISAVVYQKCVIRAMVC